MKKIVKLIILSLLSMNIVIADENYEKAYKEFSGLTEEQIKSYRDKYYLEGKEFLYNEKFMISKKINVSDPETQKGTLDIKEVSIPDYKSALISFKKSVEQTKNPLAAYSGNYIIQNFTNKQDVENLKLYVLFSEALYSQEKRICQAYLNMGEIYAQGYLRKKDLLQAKKIYQEALADEKCKSGWQGSVINSKLMKLK